VHFGLGRSKIVKEILISWPSGAHQVLHNVPADQIATITEKSGETGLPARQGAR
jgi:hypothetical protein